MTVKTIKVMGKTVKSCEDCGNLLINARERIAEVKERRCYVCIFFLKWVEDYG